MKYFDYLQSTVLRPIGLRDNVKMWLADPSNHINDPVTQELCRLAKSPPMRLLMCMGEIACSKRLPWD
jgi:hypothetical protein